MLFLGANAHDKILFLEQANAPFFLDFLKIFYWEHMLRANAHDKILFWSANTLETPIFATQVTLVNPPRPPKFKIGLQCYVGYLLKISH